MHYEPMGQFQYSLHIIVQFEPKLNTNIHFPPSSLGKDSKKKTDYLVTLIKRVGGYLAEITTS